MRIFISTVLVFAICSLVPIYVQSESSSEAIIADELKKAVSSAELEGLLVKYPNIQSIVPQLEAALVAEVKSGGIGKRFVIKDIAPKPGPVCSLTKEEVENVKPSTVVSYVMEFPGDCVPISMPGGGGFPSVEGKFVPPNPILGSSNEIFADSIHRFIGRVNFEGGFALVGQGDKLNRLTFLALKDVGYVHLRGKGKLIRKDGSDISIGDTASVR